MHILLIHQYFLEDDDPGGSRFNEMARLWTEQGHEITVIAGMIHANSSEKRDEYKNKRFVLRKQGSIYVWRCHVSEFYNRSFSGRLWGYFSFVFSSAWAGLFKVKSRFDLILVSSPPLFVGLTAYLLSKAKKIPYVFEIRDLWIESAVETGVISSSFLIKFAARAEKLILKNARLINVLTPAFRDVLIKKKNIDPGKIILIPNAADFDLSEKILKNFDAKQFRKEKNISDRFVITYVGAHGIANHLIQLIEAAELLRDTKVMFQLIGSGMQKDMLIQEVNTRKLDNVVFLDPVPKSDVFKYIIASDIGTSVLKKTEVFKTIYSNKTFDYMACRKPVLLLIDGVSRELIETARCGFFAEPENPADIAEKIRKYLLDPEILIKQGENGYRYAHEHFDRRILANRYMDNLKAIV